LLHNNDKMTHRGNIVFMGLAFLGFLLVVGGAFIFVMNYINIEDREIDKPWITYQIQIPETTATHVKIGIIHNGEGGIDVDYNFTIQLVPENHTLLYKTKFDHITWMHVWVRFYNESGSGYVYVGQESYTLEFS